MLAAAPARSTPPPAARADGAHGFDFFVGRWRTHHRRLNERLAGSHEWTDFDGTCQSYPLLDGHGNVDDSVFALPGGTVRGVGLSAYDARSGQWATWGLDARDPPGGKTWETNWVTDFRRLP